LLQTVDARFKFCTADDPLGVAVNQPLDPATKSGDLTIECIDVLVRPAPCLSFGYSAPVLVRQSRGVFQHSLDLCPHSRFELVAPDLTVIARRLPAEAMRVGTCAAVVAIVSGSSTAPQPPRHLAVKRIATAAANHEALE
jgi:hypothetical protein